MKRLDIEKFVNEVLVLKYGLSEELARDLHFLSVAENVFHDGCLFEEGEITVPDIDELGRVGKVTFTGDGSMVVKLSLVNSWGVSNSNRDRVAIFGEVTYSSKYGLVYREERDVVVYKKDAGSKELVSQMSYVMGIINNGITEASYRVDSNECHYDRTMDVYQQFGLNSLVPANFAMDMKQLDDDKAKSYMERMGIKSCVVCERNADYFELVDCLGWNVEGGELTKGKWMLTFENPRDIVSINDDLVEVTEPMSSRELERKVPLMIDGVDTQFTGEDLVANEIGVRLFLEVIPHLRDRVQLGYYAARISERLVRAKIDDLMRQGEYNYDVKYGRLIKREASPMGLLLMLDK